VHGVKTIRKLFDDILGVLFIERLVRLAADVFEEVAGGEELSDNVEAFVIFEALNCVHDVLVLFLGNSQTKLGLGELNAD
jgi:hypothetical protein